MGCKIGLKLGEITTLENGFLPDSSLSRGHYLSFFKSTGLASKMWVYQPASEHFQELIELYIKINKKPGEEETKLTSIWPIQLNKDDGYTCIGCFDTLIADELMKGNTPEGNCGKCPYNVADKPVVAE